MKKRVMALALSVCLAASMSACGGNSDQAVKALEERRAQITGTEETESATQTGEETQTEGGEETAADSKREKVGGEVMLGDDCAGYDGFKYLEEAQLDTNFSGGSKLTIFMPESDYGNAGETTAYSTKAGLGFSIDSNPYIPYDMEDAPLEEIVRELVETNYDARTSFGREKLKVSDTVSIDSQTVSANVSYCTYDNYSQSFSVYQVTTFWKRTDDYIVKVDIEINATDANDKTQATVEELESFYGVPIYFDADEAKKEAASYLQDEEFMRVKSNAVGYAVINLPRSWITTYDLDDYDVDAFMKDGELEGCDSMVLIAQKYQEQEFDEEEEPDARQLMELAEDAVGVHWDSASVTERQGTCMGDVFEITGNSCDMMEGGSFQIDVMARDGYIYYVAAVQTKDAQEDAFAWLEEFLQNGDFFY